MFRKLFLLLIGSILWLSSRAQTEIFSGRSEASQHQLIYFPAQRLATFSWQFDGNSGLSLMQATENERGEISFVREDGQKLLWGRITEDGFAGELNDDRKTLEVSLSKSNNSSLSGWQFVRLEGSFRHKNDRGTGAMIELNYFFPDVPDHSLIPVLASFYGLDAQLVQAESMMKADVDAFIERYRQMSTNADGKTMEMNWIKSASSLPVFLSGDLLCMVKTSAVSTGLQPVRRHAEYVVIDLKNNKKLTYKEIFADNSSEALSALLGESLRRQNGIEAGGSLRQAGFFNENVMPNENLIIGAEALGFAYNVYELGPPSKGQPLLMLPFNAVEPLLRPEFKLRIEYAFKKL